MTSFSVIRVQCVKIPLKVVAHYLLQVLNFQPWSAERMSIECYEQKGISGSWRKP